MGTAIAKRAATAVKQKHSISALAGQIRVHVAQARGLQTRAKDHRLQAAQKLLSLRRRIEAGEEGEVGWWDWFENQRDDICSRKDAERLMRIASAEDPKQALEDEREKTRLAVAKHREKKAAELTVSSKDDDEPDDDNKPIIIGFSGEDDDDEEGDDESTIRRRGLANCCEEAKIAAENAQYHLDWLHEHGTIDGDAALAVWQACYVWESVHRLLSVKRAPTLAQDGRSEMPVDDPTPDFGDIPPELDRRKART